MKNIERIVAISEIVASIAVIVSLVYVGIQVSQNTNAIQANTNLTLYAINQEFKLVAGADYYDLLIRFERVPESITASDSLRWRGFLNVQINIFEAALTNQASGTLEEEMAQSWLSGLDGWVCLPMAEEYWSTARTSYVAAFVAQVDRAMESQPRC